MPHERIVLVRNEDVKIGYRIAENLANKEKMLGMFFVGEDDPFLVMGRREIKDHIKILKQVLQRL